MADYTQAKLVAAVLRDLDAMSAAESSPSTEDSAVVVDRIPSTLAILASKGVDYLPDADAIPEGAFEPLVAYLTEIMAPTFGRQRDRAAMLAAEHELRVISATPPNDAVGPHGEYY